MKTIPLFFTLLLLQFTSTTCTTAPVTANPSGYDLSKPVIYTMPSVLEEISGIAFSHGHADSIFAEQDEEGKLFYFKWGDATVNHTKFSKRGDYEDVAICNGMVIMLRSDGVFFTFPLGELANKETDKAQEQAGLLPAGEYESLYADEATSSVYLLCKNCDNDKSGQLSSGFIFTMEKSGKLSLKNNFTLDDKQVARLAGKEKLRLKPSGMAQHPLTHQWYIISSVNKMLVIADAHWKPVSIYSLNPALFTQPEGIAFDNAGNLYISNEKGNAEQGSILKFVYHKKIIMLRMFIHKKNNLLFQPADGNSSRCTEY